jgi:hypothetical protein
MKAIQGIQSVSKLEKSSAIPRKGREKPGADACFAYLSDAVEKEAECHSEGAPA